MSIKKLLIFSFQLLVLFSFAQKREQLDSVFLSNKSLSAEEIIRKATENISENYFLDTIHFEINKKFDQNYEYKDFEIDSKKAKLIPKDKRNDFENEIAALVSSLKNNNHNFSYTTIFGYYQKKHAKPHLKPIIKTQVTSDVKRKIQFDYTIDKFEKILQKYVDTDEKLTVKSGLFPIERNLTTTSKKDISYQTKIVTDSYHWQKDKILNPGTFDFISDVEAYQYEIDKTHTYQGELVYKISFRPKKSRAKLMGFVIISPTDYAILQAKYSLAEGKKIWGINLKFPLGVKVAHNIFAGEFSYKRGNSSKYVPVKFEISTGEYNYIHRDLLIKTQNGFFRQADKLKFKLLLEVQEKSTEIYTFNIL
ncbi:hypothetical protein [Mesonia sp. K7]|uniref:hypothetical protein n=1 Tax=Mesonia sp. K7 TaxID=2218606 RepID=UPI000DAA400F|nr:hypothetical protein [Mesonia sp. K7]PZD76985.1 hypothetical protein DNG35_10095 [Mesonia sp. K7]